MTQGKLKVSNYVKSVLMVLVVLTFLFTFTLAAFAGCDLVVTDISWTPTNPLQGNEVTFKATIKNQGTSASPSGTIHGVLFQVDGASVNWSDNYTSSLAAGASTTVTATWGPSSKATWTATWGSHNITAYVDDVNRIGEDNESNNTYTEPLRIGMDLVVTDISWTPASPLTGNEVTFKATVKNQGTQATPSGTVLGVLFQVDGTSVNWSDNYTTSLAGGASVTLTASGGPNSKATWTATSGTHTILANVDDINRIGETDDGNNTYTEQLTVATGPSLTPTPSVTPTPTKTPTPTASVTPTPTKTPTPSPGITPTASPTPTATATPVAGSYVEYEAESGSYTGALRGPGRNYRTVESESSGRKYVNLSATGQYVQWTLTQAANAMVIRYNMPDASGGGGITANLSLYVNGTHTQDLSLTSKYAWVYGGYPWDNNPANGNAHRFYDESRFLFGTTYAAGTVIKLQKDSGDTASYYNIDFIDMEGVGAVLTQPANSLSITSYGAVANDSNDDTAAFNSVVSAAKSQGKSVWLPSGTFILNSRPSAFSGVTINGAGMWYTVLSGVGASFSPNGSNCKFYDFAMFGNTTQRIDSALETGFDGNLGTGSVIQNIWMEHLKCGIWANNGTDGLLVNGCRIRDTYADGTNLYNGTKNSTVQNCSYRNTGDDSIAIWSGSGNACTNNIVQNNTVQCPYHANAIAVYGGSGNQVKNNKCYDTVQFGSGVYLANRFSVVGFSGTTTVSGNTLTRCGSWDNDYSLPWGAIKLGAEESSMGGTYTISNNNINDCTYCGILIIGPNSCNGATFSTINITTAGTYGIEIRNNAYGSATFNSVVVSGAASGGLNNAAGGNFTINKGSGNSGW